jgi:hypothetical protein
MLCILPFICIKCINIKVDTIVEYKILRLELHPLVGGLLAWSRITKYILCRNQIKPASLTDYIP